MSVSTASNSIIGFSERYSSNLTQPTTPLRIITTKSQPVMTTTYVGQTRADTRSP